MLHMIFQTELEQNSDVIIYTLLSFIKTENKLYNEKKINLYLKLIMNFQNQNSFSIAAYNIIIKC